MAKKFLSALLAVLMVISIVPMTAMADTSYAETTPTLVVGVSASQTAAGSTLSDILGSSITINDAGEAPLLWFAMTGLGTSGKYKLSMTDSADSTKEVLGDKYVDYKSDANRVFSPKSGNNTCCVYVGLTDSHGASKGTNAQLDLDVLKPSTFESGDFTVNLINANTNKVLATKHVTLTRSKDNVWSCTEKETNDLSKIEFKKPGNDVLSIGSKPLGEVQTGTPVFALTKTADNKYDVKVTGATLKYATYAAFSSTYPVMKHGYYAVVSVPKVLCGNVVKNWELAGSKTPSITTPVTKKINTESDLNDAFSEYNKSYCDTIIYLGETAEEAKVSRPSMKLTYGTLAEQTYTFDFSGMTFPSESITAKADTSADILGKSANELQNDIQATTNGNTITVTGTSYYVTEYNNYDATMNSGNYIALTLENPAGVPMQLFSPKQANQTVEGKIKNGWKPVANKTDTIVVRLDNYKNAGYKVKIKVGANLSEGTDWVIDCSGVERREEASRLEVDALNGSLGTSIEQEKVATKGSDLQSDITSTRTTANGVTTITFKGESNYIAGWTKFSSVATEQEGNYVAIKITPPKGATDVLVNGSDITSDHERIIILDGRRDYKWNVEFKKDGKTEKYVLDFSKIKRLPAKVDGAERTSATAAPTPTAAPGMDNLKVAYDSTNSKIVLSGLVEGLENNKNMFSDVDLTVKYATNGKARVVVRFTKVGDVLEAAAIPATVAGNTLSFDTSKLLIKSENATDSVTTKAPEAAVSTSIPEEQKKAAEEVAKTLTDNSGKVSVDKDTLQKYANVISNESEAKKELVSDAATIVSANADKVPTKLKNRIDEGDVNTVVLAYAKIEVLGAETNDKNEITNFQLDITPMARTIVTTVANTSNIKLFDSTKDATANVNANAIEVKNEEIAISESTEVTLALPASYKADKAYITHKKSSGEEFHYTGKIAGSSPRTLTFTSTHGFSSFTITDTEPVKSKDATLKSVKVGGTDAVVTGTATPYTAVATLPKGTDLAKQTLTLAATNPNAKITVNGNAYTTAMTVDLSASKAATIIVTAEDGATKNTYTLTAKLSTGEPSNKYGDIPTDYSAQWVKDAINAGLMGDTGTGADGKLTFSPKGTVPRNQFAVMIARADVIAKNADIKNKDAADEYLKANYISEKLSFSDIAKQADTYIAAIEYCKKNDIISGYEDGTFKPEKLVSRIEVASIVRKWLKLPNAGNTNTNSFKDWSKIDWAQGHVNAIVKAEIMIGEGGSFGTGTVIRQDTAITLMRAYKMLTESK